MAKDSAARIELGRSFHQVGTVNLPSVYKANVQTLNQTLSIKKNKKFEVGGEDQMEFYFCLCHA